MRIYYAKKAARSVRCIILSSALTPVAALRMLLVDFGGILTEDSVVKLRGEGSVSAESRQQRCCIAIGRRTDLKHRPSVQDLRHAKRPSEQARNRLDHTDDAIEVSEYSNDSGLEMFRVKHSPPQLLLFVPDLISSQCRDPSELRVDGSLAPRGHVCQAFDVLDMAALQLQSCTHRAELSASRSCW